MSCYALQVFCEKIYYTFEQEPDKVFWRKLKEKFLDLLEKVWNTWGVEKFFVFSVKNFLMVSAGPRDKTMREWFRCLIKNVLDRLLVATSPLISDRSEHMLHLEPCQLVAIRVPIVH